MSDYLQSTHSHPAAELDAAATNATLKASSAKMDSSEASNIIAFTPPNRIDTGAALLSALAEQVRGKSRSLTASVIEIGKLLHEAKTHLPHGEFSCWVNQECGFTMRSGQNYMLAWKLAEREGEIVSLLNLGALYRLASSATPEEVVRDVVASINNGHIPTECEIEAWIARQIEPPEGTDSSQVEDELLRDLAQRLNERLGRDLAAQLVTSPWPILRKYLRQSLAS